MTDPANPIVLDMAFERLQFETGFDVRAVIAERDRYREAFEQSVRTAATYRETLKEIGSDRCHECDCWDRAREVL